MGLSEHHKKNQGRNRALAVALLLFAGLIFIVTLAKLGVI